MCMRSHSSAKSPFRSSTLKRPFRRFRMTFDPNPSLSRADIGERMSMQSARSASSVSTQQIKEFEKLLNELKVEQKQLAKNIAQFQEGSFNLGRGKTQEEGGEYIVSKLNKLIEQYQRVISVTEPGYRQALLEDQMNRSQKRSRSKHKFFPSSRN